MTVEIAQALASAADETWAVIDYDRRQWWLAVAEGVESVIDARVESEQAYIVGKVRDALSDLQAIA